MIPVLLSVLTKWLTDCEYTRSFILHRSDGINNNKKVGDILLRKLRAQPNVDENLIWKPKPGQIVDLTSFEFPVRCYISLMTQKFLIKNFFFMCYCFWCGQFAPCGWHRVQRYRALRLFNESAMGGKSAYWARSWIARLCDRARSTCYVERDSTCCKLRVLLQSPRYSGMYDESSRKLEGLRLYIACVTSRRFANAASLSKLNHEEKDYYGVCCRVEFSICYLFIQCIFSIHILICQDTRPQSEGEVP